MKGLAEARQLPASPAKDLGVGEGNAREKSQGKPPSIEDSSGLLDRQTWAKYSGEETPEERRDQIRAPCGVGLLLLYETSKQRSERWLGRNSYHSVCARGWARRQL